MVLINHGFFLCIIYTLPSASFFLLFLHSFLKIIIIILIFSDQHFFCAKFCIVAKSEYNLQQAQRFNLFLKNFTKKVGGKNIVHHL
jgi:hypothetical protein